MIYYDGLIREYFSHYFFILLSLSNQNSEDSIICSFSFSAKEFYSEKEIYIGDAHLHQKSQQPDRLINNTVYISQREVAILVNQRVPHDPIKVLLTIHAVSHISFLIAFDMLL